MLRLLDPRFCKHSPEVALEVATKWIGENYPGQQCTFAGTTKKLRGNDRESKGDLLTENMPDEIGKQRSLDPGGVHGKHTGAQLSCPGFVKFAVLK